MFLAEIGQLLLKFHKEMPEIQNRLNKVQKNKAGVFVCSDRTYYKATEIVTVQQYSIDIYIDQWI